MRSQPGTGWFIAVVVTTLLIGGWPRVDESVRAQRREHQWRPPGFGVSVVIPPGWSETRPGGAQCLARAPDDPLAGIARFEAEPDLSSAPDGAWFEAWLETRRSDRTRTIEGCARGRIDGCPSLRVEWSAAPAAGAPALHGLTLLCDRGAARLTLEIVARAADWPALAPDVELMLSGARLETP